MPLKFITEENCPLNLKDFVQYPTSHKPSDTGFNVLHFNKKNRHYEDVSSSSTEFVKKQLSNAHRCISDSQLLYHSIINCAKEINKNKEGVYVEFGFCTGKTINFIAALAFDRKVYGFDSGDGLPEPWRDRFPKGTFRFTKKINTNGKIEERPVGDNSMPFIPFTPLPNVKLSLSTINDNTLTEFKEELKNTFIEFLYIDTDLYSTANTIYTILDEYIIPDKTIVVLDEGYNFIDSGQNDPKVGDKEWEKHEFKATEQYCIRKNYKPEYLAFNENLQQLAFTFKKI